MTKQRPSVAWTIEGALTPHARDIFADVLECRFTDENDARPVTQTAPDVQLLVIPEAESCTVVAHFTAVPGLPQTEESWLSDWVARAARQAGMALPGAPKLVRTGLRKSLLHRR